MKKTTTLLVVLCCLVACRKAESPVKPADTTNLTLTEAKQWYDSQANGSIKLNDLNSKQPSGLAQLAAPISEAQSFDNKSGNYWLLRLKGNMLFQNYPQGYRKLAILRDSSGNIGAKILEIVPDGLYMQRKGSAETNDFSGRVFIYDQNYHLLGGQIRADGKVVGEIKKSSGQPSTGNLHINNVPAVVNCEWVDESYINAAGEVTIYAERVCSAPGTGIDDPNSDFDGGSGDYIGSKGGGAGPSQSTPPAMSNLPGETGPAINPKSLMDCFTNILDAGATMKVTVYVQEPWPGTTFNIGPNSVGHVAIGLTKTNGSQSITQIVGYYPNATGLSKLHCPSKVLDNGGDMDYNVSISYGVTLTNFNLIANFISNPPKTYDLANFNCTDFVYFACKSGNIIIPDATNTVMLSGPGGVGTALTPAGLGNSIEKLKGQSNVNTNGGITPNSKGPCK